MNQDGACVTECAYVIKGYRHVQVGFGWTNGVALYFLQALVSTIFALIGITVEFLEELITFMPIHPLASV